MNPQPFHPLVEQRLRLTTRRRFLQQCGTGMGALALASLLNENLFAADAKSGASGDAPVGPHFKPKAKNIIYLFMSGGPSQLELFDYKPELIKRTGEKTPEELVKNIRLAQIGKDAKLLGTNYKFANYGKSGAELSELLRCAVSILWIGQRILDMDCAALKRHPSDGCATI